MLTTISQNSLIVAEGISNGWYQVYYPHPTQYSFGYALSGTGYLLPFSQGYVKVQNVSSVGLLVRSSPGNGNVLINGANAKVWDNQKFACTGNTNTTVTPGSVWYEIYLTNNCNQLTGWISNGGVSSYLIYYPSIATQFGTVNVAINPTGAVNAGGQWNLDGGLWQNSNAQLNNISPGIHTINFKTISGWNTPSSQTINVIANNTFSSSGTYTQQTQYYNITVTPNPTNVGSVTGGGMFTSGSQITISASAFGGWNFVNWTENGACPLCVQLQKSRFQ